MMNRVMGGVALVLTALLAACDKDSSDLGTGDIEAAFTVVVDDADPAKPVTNVQATLRESEKSAAGPQGRVNLSEGDGLRIKTDKGDDLPLGKSSDGEYSATVANANATVFTFNLKRASSSADSVLTLQGPLAFTDSPDGKSFAAADTVHFAYSNTAKSRNLQPSKLLVSASHYPCGGAAVTLAPKDEIPFDDTGSFDVTAARLYGSDTPAAGDCVNIRIKRTVTADADPAFDRASSVVGTRTDRLQIKIK